MRGGALIILAAPRILVEVEAGARGRRCTSRYREQCLDDAVTLEPDKQRGHGNG